MAGTITTKRVSTLSLRYAQALMDLADQADAVASTAEQLDAVAHCWAQEPALTHMFSGYLLSTQKRAAVLQAVFQGQVSDLLYHFLQVLNLKNRMLELPIIARAFTEVLDERSGRLAIEATTAVAMEDPIAHQLRQRLDQVLDRKVKLTCREDPRIIGGLKLRIGDTLYDASLATELRQLRQTMTRAVRERAGDLMSPDPS